MKRILFLLLSLTTLAGYAQYPISSINITMPANPAANTANWYPVMPPVMITAQAQMRQGQVPGDVQESRILVTIKQGGSKKYGSYTADNAPLAGFSSAVKTWSGANAVALLGKDYTLPPGQYELCVQFFNYGQDSSGAGGRPLSNEVCKSFTIADAQPDTKPITSIGITMSPTPPANTSNWGGVVPPVMITAQTRLNNGKVPPEVMASRILVIIKQGGSKKYGIYTPNNAPESGFTTAVKTWSGANAVSLLGQDATLPPGEYELCVQLFTQGAAGMIAISDEKCKPFTIQNSKDEKYNPPVNVAPVDKKVFTEKEIKEPMTFRWTPILPRPQVAVVYKLKVWQLMQGQNPSQAIQSSQPVIEEEVKDQTQFMYRKGWDGKGNWVWRVEATDGQGKVLGVSEATGFSAGSTNSVMMAQCNFTPRLDSIYCTGPCGNGKMGYRVRLKLDNTASGSTLMNFANTSNYSLHTPIPAYVNVSTINNLVQAWNTAPPPYGSPNPLITATSVSPFYPSTIAAGTAVLREVDICVPINVTLPIRLRVFISMMSSNGVPGLCDDDVLINTLPPCPCTYCNDDMIQLTGQNTITDANNVMTVNNTISIPGIQVKQFKAELIGISYKPQNNNEQCWVCNKDDNQWGNFVAGTFTSPYPSMVNGVFPSLPCCGGNSHHTIGWWGTATSIMNRPLQLKISLPPASTLSCCPYNVEFCIRYTFTDAECRSCSVVKCFKYTRNPQTGGVIYYDNALPADIKVTPRYFKKQ
ncbi:MAG: hypothetical protein ABI685_06300 [Ferruginibacter sp.]